MGRVHAAAWAQTPADLAGVLSSDREGAAALVSEHGGKVYDSLGTLLADVDVVDAERLDPGKVLAGARTVIALAIAYRRAPGERRYRCTTARTSIMPRPRSRSLEALPLSSRAPQPERSERREQQEPCTRGLLSTSPYRAQRTS